MPPFIIMYHIFGLLLTLLLVLLLLLLLLCELASYCYDFDVVSAYLCVFEMRVNCLVPGVFGKCVKYVAKVEATERKHVCRG